MGRFPHPGGDAGDADGQGALILAALALAAGIGAALCCRAIEPSYRPDAVQPQSTIDTVLLAEECSLDDDGDLDDVAIPPSACRAPLPRGTTR